jgi:hypothetical protein
MIHVNQYFGEGEFFNMEEKLELIALKEFEDNGELYRVVDFLNKSLKDKNIIFGLRRNGDKATITIYET